MESLPPALRTTLASYAGRLQTRFGPRLRFVRLFGSWARGDAHDDSDVDVAVVVDDLTRDEWHAAIDDAVDAELERVEGVTLSPFVLSTERWNELVRRERRIATDIREQGIDA